MLNQPTSAGLASRPRRKGATACALAILAAVALLPAAGHAQSAGVSEDAALLLKRMTDYVGQLPQLGMDTTNTLEVVLTSGQKLQFASDSRVVVQRPDRMRADRVGDVISQSLFYDGRTVTLLDPVNNVYATSPAPATIDKMLDFARDSLDLIAPAGDLITTDAYQRLMADSNSGFVVGKSFIGGVRCDHLAFRGDDVDWQVWIEDDSTPVPRKFVITTLDVAGAPQFAVVVNNWTTSPDVSAGQFQFTPPAGARRIDFVPVSNSGATP
jgi:hypothetical protein